MAVMMVVVVVVMMGDDDCDVCIAIVQRARGLFLALGYRWRIGTGTYMQSLMRATAELPLAANERIAHTSCTVCEKHVLLLLSSFFSWHGVVAPVVCSVGAFRCAETCGANARARIRGVH
jgi:hypothetical protein